MDLEAISKVDFIHLSQKRSLFLNKTFHYNTICIDSFAENLGKRISEQRRFAGGSGADREEFGAIQRE